MALCDDLPGYELYYSREAGSWLKVKVPTGEGTSVRMSHELMGLYCGTQYQLYLIAHNPSGHSEASETVSTKTLGEGKANYCLVQSITFGRYIVNIIELGIRCKTLNPTSLHSKRDRSNLEYAKQFELFSALLLARLVYNYTSTNTIISQFDQVCTKVYNAPMTVRMRCVHHRSDTSQCHVPPEKSTLSCLTRHRWHCVHHRGMITVVQSRIWPSSIVPGQPVEATLSGSSFLAIWAQTKVPWLYTISGQKCGIAFEWQRPTMLAAPMLSSLWEPCRTPTVS